MEDLGALPLLVMAAGLAVAAWGAWSERTGRSRLGARPEGALAQTGSALLVGFGLWAVGTVALGVFVQGAGFSAPVRVLCATLMHVLVALVVLRAALSGPAPTTGGGRAVVAGVVGGVATYGVVALISIGLVQAYEGAGVDVPSQNVVDILRAADPLGKAVLVGCAVVLAPFAEEVFYRGILLPACARAMPVRTALVVQALVFGFSHFWHLPAAWPLSLAIAVVGWGAGWLYLRTGSLMAAIALHMTFNGLQVALLFAAPPA